MPQPDTDEAIATWLVASGWEHDEHGWHHRLGHQYGLDQEAAAEEEREWCRQAAPAMRVLFHCETEGWRAVG